ncbi:MAG: hypothetical protein APF77_01455 [Clostridia bacterium BRH_c25]|nr:MAG: hypothetical protein APF77_01455 [Clostridia bacterium BRH_c25]
MGPPIPLRVSGIIPDKRIMLALFSACYNTRQWSCVVSGQRYFQIQPAEKKRQEVNTPVLSTYATGSEIKKKTLISQRLSQVKFPYAHNLTDKLKFVMLRIIPMMCNCKQYRIEFLVYLCYLNTKLVFLK